MCLMMLSYLQFVCIFKFDVCDFAFCIGLQECILYIYQEQHVFRNNPIITYKISVPILKCILMLNRKKSVVWWWDAMILLPCTSVSISSTNTVYYAIREPFLPWTITGSNFFTWYGQGEENGGHIHVIQQCVVKVIWAFISWGC